MHKYASIFGIIVFFETLYWWKIHQTLQRKKKVHDKCIFMQTNKGIVWDSEQLKLQALQNCMFEADLYTLRKNYQYKILAFYEG